jgi:hypothetical protein
MSEWKRHVHLQIPFRISSGYSFSSNYFSETSMQKQNPENYLVRKGTSSDHKERDMQGAVIIHW